DQSRAGRIARGAEHEPARRARSHSHTDGRPEITELDFAAVARSARTGMPPAADCRFVARSRSARGSARLPEIDPRSGTGRGPIEPGFGKRARSRRTQDFAPANPRAQRRTAKADRSD